MDGPFDIAGRTRRGAESACLLTLLAVSTAERVRFSYQLNEHDVDDVTQGIFLHVINNWKHWHADKCPAGAALRVMVGQGCSRAVAALKTKGDLRIVLATDTSSEQGQDFLNWVPAIESSAANWSPADCCTDDDRPERDQNELHTATATESLEDEQPLLFDAFNDGD